MGPESTLTIGRWRAEYRVPGDHPDPELLRRSLDEASQSLAREALASALQSMVDDGDPSVWLIRRLDLDMTVNTGWQRGLTTQVWAGHLARLMARTFDAGADGENVMYFPDWPAYLAHFLADLGEGLAWGRWYYRSFEGLRMLPFSAAARTALLDNPLAGWAALGRLTDAQRRRLIEGLSRQDARRVLDGIFNASAGPVDFDELLAACERARHFALAEEHFALLLALETARKLGQPAGSGLAAAARAVAYLRRRIAEGVRPKTIPYLYLENADAGHLLPLAACPAELLPALVAALTDGRPPVAPADSAPPRRYTSFGGLFLLLPELERLPLAEMVSGFPLLSGEDGRAVIRLLLLVRNGGPDRAPFLFSDPLLRDLTGVSPRLSPENVAAWLKSVRPRAWQGFLRAVAAAGPDIPPQSLGLVKVRAAGGPVLTVVDLGTGAWQAILPYDARRGRHWRALRSILESADQASWRGDPGLLAEAAAAVGLPDLREVTGKDEEQMQDSSTIPAATVAARLAGVEADLRYLRAPVSWRLPRQVDLALALAAQRLLRAFSRDLAGFQGSGMAYLFDQFLDFTAGLDETGELGIAYLSRPRLGLVLQRAGKLRLSYRLSWLDGRKIALYPEA